MEENKDEEILNGQEEEISGEPAEEAVSEREETERIVREAGAQALRKLDGMTEAERNEYYDDIKFKEKDWW